MPHQCCNSRFAIAACISLVWSIRISPKIHQILKCYLAIQLIHSFTRHQHVTLCPLECFSVDVLHCTFYHFGSHLICRSTFQVPSRHALHLRASGSPSSLPSSNESCRLSSALRSSPTAPPPPPPLPFVLSLIHRSGPMGIKVDIVSDGEALRCSSWPMLALTFINRRCVYHAFGQDLGPL